MENILSKTKGVEISPRCRYLNQHRKLSVRVIE